MTCLKLKMKSNWIGHFLGILTDVLLPIKFLPNIIFILNFLNDEIGSGFLSKKRYKEKWSHKKRLELCRWKNYWIWKTRQDLARKERVDIAPISIVYEPIFQERFPVPCFFTDKIYLAYKSYVGRFEEGKERIFNRVVKQCHYCENLLAKNNEAMKKHLSICAAKERITYAFDNGQVITFQDNFKYLGDVPFTVYFNFETATTSDSVFWPKNVCSEFLSSPFISSILKSRQNCHLSNFSTDSWRDISNILNFKQEHAPFLKK